MSNVLFTSPDCFSSHRILRSFGLPFIFRLKSFSNSRQNLSNIFSVPQNESTTNYSFHLYNSLSVYYFACQKHNYYKHSIYCFISKKKCVCFWTATNACDITMSAPSSFPRLRAFKMAPTEKSSFCEVLKHRFCEALPII